MPLRSLSYPLMLAFVVLSYVAHADSDSTRNKLFVEAQIESLYGHSFHSIGTSIYDYNKTYGLRLNVGYSIRPHQHLKIGLAFHQLSYHYTIERSLIGPRGSPITYRDYEEDVWLKTFSSGIIYSVDLTSKFSIDLETFFSFKLFDEYRMREGTMILENHEEGLIVFGISHETKNNFVRFNTRFNFNITSDTSVGFILGLRTDKITAPLWINDVNLKFLYGLSLTYRM